MVKLLISYKIVKIYMHDKTINNLLINQNVTFTTIIPHMLLALEDISLIILYLHSNASRTCASNLVSRSTTSFNDAIFFMVMSPLPIIS